VAPCKLGPNANLTVTLNLSILTLILTLTLALENELTAAQTQSAAVGKLEAVLTEYVDMCQRRVDSCVSGDVGK